MRGQRIGILCGGPPEAPGPRAARFDRPDPLETGPAAGKAVRKALQKRGYDAVLVELGRDLDVALRALRVQVAFLASRGRTGEDGSVQGLLELLGIPYTGSDVLASALSLDCQKARAVLRQHNLPTPPYYVIKPTEVTDPAELMQRHSGFGYPAVVRPRHDNPLCQPRVVRGEEALAAAVAAVSGFDDDVLVERHGVGRVVAVAILNGAALGAVELVARDGGGRVDRAADPANLLSAAEDEDRLCGLIPPRVSGERLRGVTELALRSAGVLGCWGPIRVDVLVSDRGNELVLGVNPRPALSPRSLLGRVAAAVGRPFEELVEQVLLGAQLHGRRPRDAELSGPPLDRRADDPAVLYNGPDRRSVPMNMELGHDPEVA